jgi:hypothetical protein
VRRISRRERVLLGLLALAAVGLGFGALRRPGNGPTALAKTPAGASLPAVPRIGLSRLDVPRPDDEAGRRDLFDYGAARMPEAVSPTPPPFAPPPAASLPAAVGEAGAGGPTRPSLPPLNLKYIGSVESAKGVKVAVLLTDHREVLTGQAGQVVANRYRISRIGIESVDLEDVNSGQSRRIPLRGN